MLTGAVELMIRHRIVLIGSAGWPAVEWDDGPASADGRHVAVRTRDPVAVTRVRIWEHAMPETGHVVFDGELDLEDATIFVGDIERIRRWTQRIGQGGVQPVVVRADDPGCASRVDVGLRLGARAVVPVAPSITAVTSEVDGMHPANARGIVLDGHDSPRTRLAAVIMLFPAPDPAKPWQEGFELTHIAEWLRWLGTDLSRDRAERIAAGILRDIRTIDGAVTPEAAGRIADRAMAAISGFPRSG